MSGTTQNRAHLRKIALAGLVATAALTMSGTVNNSAQARERKPDNLVAVGDPVDCLQLSSIRSSQVRDDRTIDFEVNGRTIYRNTLPHSCPGLGFEQKFAYKTSLNQLCSVDIVYVLQSFGGGLSQGAGCGLGKFQKMEKPAK